MTLGQLVEVLGGRLLQGNPDLAIDGVNALGAATPFEIVFADDLEAESMAFDSNAGVVVVKEGQRSTRLPPGKCVVEVLHPRLWFALAAKLLKPVKAPGGVHPTAVLGAHVKLSEDITIGPNAVLGDHVHVGKGTRIAAGSVIGRGVRIGEFCRLDPRVVIYSGTTVGNWVTVQAGAVLGSDGFGYVRDPESGAYTQFPQQGTLVIEDDVEVGANTTIDRGALSETRIGRGSKIDNLVHVGHNCKIGEDVILVALTGISGSSSVGKGAVLAGQVGIGDHAHVGPGVILGGQAGVFSGKTVTNEGAKPGSVLWGTPARPLKQVLKEQAVLARLARGFRKGEGTGNKE
jgi:UDP-3-O-[3-hydroxymyristoyl] glucosamine N-acyltransferase